SEPAQPISSGNPVAGVIPTARPADFIPAIAVYRRHVRRELGAMLGDVGRLRAAVARGDLSASKAAWLDADAHYESIGAAYGAFGDLDAAINGRPAGLQEGVRSRDFTGLHRVELALWERRSTRDAAPAAARLSRDVATLRRKVARMKIDPFEYSLRAHEVLEDALHLELSGAASPWSGSALTALRANVRGTRVVLTSLAPLIARRDPARLARARAALDRVAATVSARELPRWDEVPQRERERIAGLTAAAAERLAYVPELVDPRPPRPKKRVLG
ncbi:EfeM/EfeO family lipoprotein, partial [Solirubrobacter soli]|uniref:EfeM/EfeO family lipoprotein n=1 Tax=Solirubrobacter soli TaxID=363832 RepID=UPI00146D072C